MSRLVILVVLVVGVGGVGFESKASFGLGCAVK